jgi:putative ABC transport system permease protein
VTQQRFGQAELGGVPTSVSATTLDSTMSLEYVAGDTQGLRGEGLIVDEDTATSRGWSVGDRVEARSPMASASTCPLAASTPPTRRWASR